MAEEKRGDPFLTVKAVIKRKDGTVEDLGTIAETYDEMQVESK